MDALKWFSCYWKMEPTSMTKTMFVLVVSFVEKIHRGHGVICFNFNYALIWCVSVFVVQDGYTALMKATISEHLDVVELLLNGGANIDEINKVCFGRCFGKFFHSFELLIFSFFHSNVCVLKNHGLCLVDCIIWLDVCLSVERLYWCLLSKEMKSTWFNSCWRMEPRSRFLLVSFFF